MIRLMLNNHLKKKNLHTIGLTFLYLKSQRPLHNGYLHCHATLKSHGYSQKKNVHFHQDTGDN